MVYNIRTRRGKNCRKWYYNGLECDLEVNSTMNRRAVTDLVANATFVVYLDIPVRRFPDNLQLLL